MNALLRCEIATSRDGAVSIVGNVTPSTHPKANATAIPDGHEPSDAVVEAFLDAIDKAMADGLTGYGRNTRFGLKAALDALAQEAR